MASITTNFGDGSQVDVGMFGYESVIGMSALMGTRRSLNRISTQIPGSGYSCTIERARTEFQRGGVFQQVTLCYVQSQLVRASQLAGCNAKHTIEQRLARWLLICADRTNRVEFKASHEFLAAMLGSTRPTISVVACAMKRAGLIQYRRGMLVILNIPELENVACECYVTIKNHLRHDTDSGNQFVAPATGHRLWL